MLKVDLSWKDDDQSGKKESTGTERSSGGIFIPAEPEEQLSTEEIPEFDLGPEELLDHIPDASPEPEPEPEPLLEEVSPEETPESGAEEFASERHTPESREKVPLSDRLPESPVVIPPAGDEKPPRKISGKTVFAFFAAVVIIAAIGAAIFIERGRISLPAFHLPEISLPDFRAVEKRIAAILPKRGSKSMPAPQPVPQPAPPVPAAPEAVAPSAPPETPVPSAPSAVPAEQGNEARTVPAPAAKPSSSAMAPIPGGDAALVALRRIGQATPERVWLTSVTVGTGGVYEMEGMAFAHDALQTFIATLGKTGTISAKNVPPESNTPDAVYRFTVTGKLKGVASPGVLDPLPPERITSFVKKLRNSGVTVVRLPRLGEVYGDDELPFEVEGLYSRTGALLGTVVFRERCVVYQVSIRPAQTSREGNRVRIAFSLRMVGK